MIVVIGHGIVGCYAASMLARRGEDVTIIGSGTTATSLSTGCLSGDPRIAPKVAEWLGPPYVHGDIRTMTGRGNEHRCAVAPWSAIPVGEGPVTAVCLGDLSGMGPDWLRAIGMDVIDVDVGARRWSSLRRRPDVVDAVIDVIDGVDGRVMIPPFLPASRLVDSIERMREVADVFEAVVPMAIPGARLQDACVDAAKASGCRVLEGRRVDRVVVEGDEVVSVRASTGIRSETFPVSRLVIAYGGLVCGGLAPVWTRSEDSLGAFMTRGDAIATDDGAPILTNGARCANATVAGAAAGDVYDGERGALDALSGCEVVL